MRFSSLFSGVLALAGIASTSAFPVAEHHLEARSSADHFLKHEGIITPNENTTWTAGQKVSITWNTTEIHNENGTLPVINLYSGDDDYPLPILALATNFQSNTGSISITAPNVPSACYYIKIKSYCGCKIWRSDIFTITNPNPNPNPNPHPPPPTSPVTTIVPPPSTPVVPPPSTPVVPPPSTPVVPPPSTPVVPPTTSPVVPPTTSPVVPSTTSSVVPPPSSSVVPTPTPAITAPNSKTTWIVGSNATISWDVSQVKNENGTLKSIELFSATGTTSAATLAQNFVSNTGSIHVVVPKVIEGAYFIKINSYRNESWTSADFTIETSAGANPITSPNAKTTWTAGSKVKITWDASVVKNENGTLKSIDLYALTGKTPVANLAQSFDSTTGSLQVEVPEVANGSYYILISSFRAQSWASEVFTIASSSAPPASGGIISPNATTVWTVGDSEKITWDVSQVKNEDGRLQSIELFALTGKTPVATLATNFVSNTGFTTVKVPKVQNGTYYIKINSPRAVSWVSADFTIQSASAPPSGAPITAPDASTVWVVGGQSKVSWNPSVVKNENGTLKSIDLYALTGKTPVATLVSHFDSTTGSVTFTVPSVGAGTYRVEINSYGSANWLSSNFQINTPAVSSSSASPSSSAAASTVPASSGTPSSIPASSVTPSSTPASSGTPSSSPVSSVPSSSTPASSAAASSTA